MLTYIMLYTKFNFSLFIELCDGKKTGTHLGKNQLDRERLRVCVVELVRVSVLYLGHAFLFNISPLVFCLDCKPKLFYRSNLLTFIHQSYL